jgi:putative iron-regulated protein
MPSLKSSINNIILMGSVTAMGLAGCSVFDKNEKDKVSNASVIETYINIAKENYQDSLTAAQDLEAQVNAFLATPTEANLQKTKDAWIAARAPYQQTEVYRFGNASVDDWEGKVNAWPLDEGLIDYVDASYGAESDENPFYAANIIANATPTIGGIKVDASQITPELLSDTLHEIDEVESNVATGYHVIEFLLWGQDLNGNQPGAGSRPASDFSLTDCTGGNCERRRQYLQAATSLLVKDLEDMANNWKEGGASVAELTAKGEAGALATMLTGMGSLAYGELAGERTKLGLMLHDPEEEHDCFSDNTHASHYYDALGIKNVYLGQYANSVDGASLSDLVRATNAELDAEMQSKLNATMAAAQAMVDAAAKGQTFDVLIGEGNTEGNQIVQVFVDSLVDQAKTTEKVITALELNNIEFEGSDSLDNPSAVQL